MGHAGTTSRPATHGVVEIRNGCVSEAGRTPSLDAVPHALPQTTRKSSEARGRSEGGEGTLLFSTLSRLSMACLADSVHCGASIGCAILRQHSCAHACVCATAHPCGCLRAPCLRHGRVHWKRPADSPCMLALADNCFFRFFSTIFFLRPSFCPPLPLSFSFFILCRRA